MDRVTENDLIVLFPYLAAALLVGVAIVKPPAWLRAGLDRVRRWNARTGRPLDILVAISCAAAAVLKFDDRDGGWIIFGMLAIFWTVRVIRFWRGCPRSSRS